MSKGIFSLTLMVFVIGFVFSLQSPYFHFVSADCSPYDVYFVSSISSSKGWLLVVVGQDSWTCEMIAGEWTPRLTCAPNEYYILTDGNKTILLGGTDLSRGTLVGFMNETIYVLIVTTAHVSYRNVTITIEGVPHNFTLLKNVTMKMLYRFNGVCLENVSTCRIVSYPNGTKTNTCNGSVWNVSGYKIPGSSLIGVPVKIENGAVHFTLGRRYSLALPEGVNASVLKLEAFEAKHGVVLVNMRTIRVPAGENIKNIPILFVTDNKTVHLPKFTSLEEFICAKCGTNTTNSAIDNKDKKPICGPGFTGLLALVPLIIRKR